MAKSQPIANCLNGLNISNVEDLINTIKEIFQNEIWGIIQRVLNWGIHWDVGNGTVHITVGFILSLFVTYFVTRYLLKLLRRVITRNMKNEDKRKFISVFSFVNYVIYLLVFIITMSAAGINVTVLLTASAALFVGLGLALQILFQDVIGGISIIIDKSVNVGDIVEADGKICKIYDIKLRTTRGITRDDKVIVIPNHKFITELVYNHTQNRKATREMVSVGVAYGSDVNKVTRLLEEAASEHPLVIDNPKPFVLFDDFGDSALLFSLHFFVNDSFATLKITSQLRYKINQKFIDNNVTIPFPQRDVHLYQNKA